MRLQPGVCGKFVACHRPYGAGVFDVIARSTPALDDELPYAGDQGRPLGRGATVFAVNKRTGDKRWATKVKSFPSVRPASYGGPSTREVIKTEETGPGVAISHRRGDGMSWSTENLTGILGRRIRIRRPVPLWRVSYQPAANESDHVRKHQPANCDQRRSRIPRTMPRLSF
jgi:outer membrane protein assembly factor BamB